jgi:hypothetical protein
MADFSRDYKSGGESASFDKKLIAYAIAGGAVLAAPAHAGIIEYGGPILDTNSTNPISIFVGGTEYDFSSRFDLSQPKNYWSSPNSGLIAGPLSLNQPVMGASFGGASKLNKGMIHRPSSSCSVSCTSSMTRIGRLQNGINTFLGLQFGTSGTDSYYGWVELNASVSISGDAEVQVLDYAYRDTPNTDILVGHTSDAAPEPSTLALFALGAAGVAAVRRRRAKRA